MDEQTPDLIQGTGPATDVTDVTDVTPGVTEPEAEPVQPDPDAPPNATKGQAGDETPEPEPKPSGFEKRISKLTYQAREAERQAAYWRGIAEGKGGAPAPQGAEPTAKDGPPKQEQFESYDEYLRALTRHEIRTEMAQERQKLTQEMEARELRGGFESRAQAMREKHADFDEVVFNESLSVSVPMRDAFMNSPDGAEMAYYLGQHPEEAARISRLSPYHQMLELGRVSARIAAPPPPAPVPKPVVSAAPAPITPVKAGGKAVEGSLRDDVSVAEWMNRRNRELGRR